MATQSGRRCEARKVEISAIALALLLASGCLAPVASQQAVSLEDLAFMSGCWRGELADASGTIEEIYTAANADLMLGTTRYIRDGTAASFEFTRIYQDSSGVFLIPSPSGRPSVPFRLVKLEGSEAVFENPNHDFPKRIIYRRPDDRTLIARIEADGDGQEWTLSRVSCVETLGRERPGG